MAITVHLPKLGMTMEEGTVVRWLVADGEHVERGQLIFEMETEKVELEIEADDEGVLKPLVEEGTTLGPGAIVACLLAPGETAVPQEILDRVAAQTSRAASSDAAGGDAAAEAVTAGPAASAGATTAPPGGGRIVASPIARRLATEHDVDLSELAGSGPDGRIVEGDVQREIDGSSAGRAAPAPAPTASTLAYRGRRHTIGERMLHSLQEMAQLTLSAEARVDDAMRMLHGVNREWREERVVATLTGLVVRACALALLDHGRLNARIDGDEIVLEPEINIGLAVDIDAGLMVPVVRGADALTLKQLAGAIGALNERAKANELSLDDVTGGTFTVTSLEGLTVDAFTPVINPPQAAILGVGRVRDVAAFDGARVERAQATTLSLTFDHRVVDGAPAARFLGRVSELLARPYMLM